MGDGGKLPVEREGALKRVAQSLPYPLFFALFRTAGLR
jgi:hypothetical protein